ncbi:MFS transporter [Listeria monocytogenes]|nr:MFS transporter [Listeria monocytogenes]EEO6238615.1 MFS transporter [Listeria monocytogenes]
MWDQNLFNLESKNKQNGSQNQKPKTRLQQLNFILAIVGVVFYPFVIAGAIIAAPVFYFFQLDKKKHGASTSYVPALYSWQKIIWLGGFVLFLVNGFLFAKVIPEAYFSAYEFFPLNLMGSPLTFGWSTIPPLILNGLFFACCIVSMFIFTNKQRIESSETRRRRIKESTDYLERRRERFANSAKLNDKYEEIIQNSNSEEFQNVLKSAFIGSDEYGKDVWLPCKELNQHAVIFGSTGTGKTTLLKNLFDYGARINAPMLIIDGKGSPDTRIAVEEFAEKHNRKIHVFTDEHDVRYNPIKYGNSIVIRDKLISMAKTESTYYSTGAEKLLQLTIQLMDQVVTLNRDFPTLSNLFNPKYVLEVFNQQIDWEHLNYDELYKKQKAFFDGMIEKAEQTQGKKEKKDEKEKEAEVKDVVPQARGRLAVRQKQLESAPGQAEVIKSMFAKLPLYQRIKFVKYLLPKGLASLFFDLLESYEASENGVFQLYLQADNLRSNVDLLLKSEIGHLFDTSNCGSNELDLMSVDANNEIVYVALDGLIYKEFIESLAHFFIGEINFLASYRYKSAARNAGKEGEDGLLKPFFLFCDEPSTYLSENFMDTVNKTRGAGIHTIFSPQTITDLTLKHEKLDKILIGNSNTFFIGRMNDPEEAEYTAKLLGTFTDIELTEVTQQEEGYGNMNNVNWKGEKGTKREVSVFKIHPDTIKELKQGEFIMYRKASTEYEEPRKVYIRQP